MLVPWSRVMTQTVECWSQRPRWKVQRVKVATPSWMLTVNFSPAPSLSSRSYKGTLK